MFAMDLSHAELQHKQQHKQQQQSTLLSLEVPQVQFEALSIHSQTKTQTQAQPIPISTHQHHSDPRHLMPPLQIQVTDYSPQSQSTHKPSSNHALASSWPNGSTSSLEKSTSNNNTNHHSHQNDSSPPTSTTLSSASGHLAVPEKNRSGSRRWSLTGIFFGDRRKSASEQSHIPNGPNNKNGQNPSNGEGQSTSPGNSSSSGLSNIIRTRSRSSSNGSSTGKPTSSGRSSLSDISRSFISSMRRVSSVDPPPSSNTGNHDAMIAATAAVSASIAAAMGNSPKHASVPCYSSGGEDMEDDMVGSESVYSSIQRGWIGENRYVAMATPKGPPLDPLTLSKRPPLKSILKKQSVNNGDSTIVAPTPSIAGGSSTTSSILESDSVHPMAPTSDEDSPNSKPFVLPTEHRAKLVTNSPPPTPQVGPTSPPADHRPGHSNSSSSSSGSSNGSNSIKPTSQGSYKSQKRDSTPSDHKPGVQSNYRQRSRGDDISQAEMLNDEMMTVGARAQELGRQYHSYSGNGGGSRGSLGSNTSSRQRSRGDEISQAEMLNDEMMSVGARAQDLERQYYGYSGNGGGSQGVNTNNNNGDNNASGMPSPKRRAIGFMDRIEIIPAHRKADYNRQSDKNVTFRVLTPELRGDIRDELNHYKLHEMAVHVDSMNNTAFH